MDPTEVWELVLGVWQSLMVKCLALLFLVVGLMIFLHNMYPDGSPKNDQSHDTDSLFCSDHVYDFFEVSRSEVMPRVFFFLLMLSFSIVILFVLTVYNCIHHSIFGCPLIGRHTGSKEVIEEILSNTAATLIAVSPQKGTINSTSINANSPLMITNTSSKSVASSDYQKPKTKGRPKKNPADKEEQKVSEEQQVSGDELDHAIMDTLNLNLVHEANYPVTELHYPLVRK
jgi:hypothetical protein